MCGEVGYVEVKKLKRAGDMQEPCGTPVCECLQGEVVLRYRHLAILPLR